MLEQIIVIGGLIIGIIFCIAMVMSVGFLLLVFGALEVVLMDKNPITSMIVMTVIAVQLAVRISVQLVSLSITRLYVGIEKNRQYSLLTIGCLTTATGTVISSGIVFGLGIALIALSSIAIRIQENREFTNLGHDLALYQSMKRKSGIINLGIGAMYCIITIAITGVVAINIYTIPGLVLMGFGAVKVMKHSFIKRSSPEALSFAIRIKYFYRNTTGLIAKAMNFKMSQKTQRVAA